MESLTSGTMTGAGSFRCSDCGYTLTLAGSDVLSDCPYCGGREFVRASLFSRASGLARSHAGKGSIGAMAGARADTGAGDTEVRAPQMEEPLAGGPIFARRTRVGRSSAAGASSTGAPRGGIDGGAGDSARTGSGKQAGEEDTIRQGAVGGVLSRSEPIDGDAWLQRAREQLERIERPGEYLAYEESDELRTVALTREWTRIGRSLAADVRFDDPTVSRRHALVVRQADGVRVLDDRSLNGVFVNGSRIEWKVLRDGDEILVGRYRLRFLSIAPQPAEADAAQASSLRDGD
jgi:DNA-directed RNA polymerase subunit RPC12/RpoP